MPKEDILTRKKRSKARACFQSNQLADAEQGYLQILKRHPTDLEALQYLGTIAFRQGLLSEAKTYFEQALDVSPKHHELWYQLGCVSDRFGDIDSACIQFERAIDLKSKFSQARLALGNIKAGQGLLGKAIDQYQAVLALEPSHTVARNNLANVLANQGDAHSALSEWDRTLKQQPDYYSAYSNKLLALNYLTEFSQSDIYTQHKIWANQVANKIISSKSHRNNPDPVRQLHIAYVSADFREHSVAYFIEPILMHHSRDNFKLYCYSNVANPDSVTSRLLDYADEVRLVASQPDQTVADWIREDKIDILIDLSGHTSGNRLLLFAQKPAPIQITYLGYPNTTGLDTMDYRLTDEVADPPDDSGQFSSEELLRIPGGFLCYTPPQAAPDIGILPFRENGYVTFGAFNNVAKITAEVISVWAHILSQVQNSQILFKNRAFSDNETCQRHLKLFEKYGIPAERIVFSGLTTNKRDYLDFYNQIDIALDSFPYNGTTTTFDALFMGVPTVTLTGVRHASRVGTSILNGIGINELVTKSHQEYIDKAASLAKYPDRLETMRLDLRSVLQTSPLCDGVRISRELEQIYRNVWHNWCSKQNLS